MKQVLLIVLLGVFQDTCAQVNIPAEIEGRVITAGTGEAVSFAKVYNRTSHKGTIAGVDGFFRITVQNPSDSLIISAIGFNTYATTVPAGTTFLPVNLTPTYLELEEMNASPNDNARLFDLVHACARNSSALQHAKAYYYLRSFADSQQVELVEGFYNTEFTGYDIRSMEMKAGRLGLVHFNNSYFISEESSKAITSMKLSDPDDYFPDTPIELKKKAARTHFYISREASYSDESGDSVYVLRYTPKDSSGTCFDGQIWLNISDMVLQKITMHCDSCAKHPFLPLFRGVDVLKKVSLSITKTFTRETGNAVLNHIDFSYDIDYMSRIHKTALASDTLNYSVHTDALLYLYDYGKSFELPEFHLEPHISDYRQITAFPYNSFFWQWNDEYSLNDSRKENEDFYTRSETKNDFKIPYHSFHLGYQESFIHWTPNRILIREMAAEPATGDWNLGQIKASSYNLDVKIFMDINTYRDSTNVLTETIIDPYTTYYALPMDKYTHCFINMYFDLCEMLRREMETAFRKSSGTAEAYKNLYTEYMVKLEAQKTRFLKEVDRGTHRKAMEKWNALIYEALAIDNIALFGLYTEEEAAEE